jgi:formylglycine-generating enzyme required for sulfatase activity
MPYEDILCSWLVRSALVSLTILLIGSGAVLIWRQPLRRVRIIELVLAGCLIAPWLGLIPGYPQFSVVRSQATAIKHQEAPLLPTEPMTEPAMIEPMMPLPTLDRAAPPVPSTTIAEAPVTVEAPAHAFEIRPWIIGIYLAGVVIGAGWWLVGIAGLVRLLWSSQPAPTRCRELLTEISSGRGNRVRLFVNRRLSQPFASAWGRAVIVLPENLCGDEQMMRWCLAHEWAHVDGHDFRTWLLAGLAKVLFFYQPLLWWLRRQLRLCQDFVADSQAARQAPEVEDYAEFLTARATGRLHPALGLSMGCRKSEIYRRVIMLLNNESLESRTPRLWTISITVAALVLVGVVAAVSLVPRAVAEEKPAISQSKEAGGRTKELPKELTVSPAKELTVDLGKGVKLEMILIPAGEFMMGSPDSDKGGFHSEKPQHRVRITKPFYLGTFLVTQEQWETVMGKNPSHFKGPKNPVEMISWDDCQQFLGKLNAKVGSGAGKFQLPSEAQWEYACRAGSTTRYCFGDDEEQLGDYAWYGENSDGKTHPVGEKKPNAWGLYDMYGNVWEWCQDRYGYYKESPVDDPSGSTGGWGRVGRGGGWNRPAGFCRSAFRSYDEPGFRSDNLGFRVSLVPAPASAVPAVPKANDQSSKTSAAKPAVSTALDGQSAKTSAAKPADEVSPASDQSATKPSPKEIEVAKAQLQAWKKARDLLKSGVFRASGRLRKIEEKDDPKCEGHVEYYCAFDYRKRLFRCDHVVPYVLRVKERTGKTTRTVDTDIGKYIGTPEESFEWFPDGPATIYARGSTDKPMGQIGPFDVRLLGMGSTGDFFGYTRYETMVPVFLDKWEVIDAAEAGKGIYRIHSKGIKGSLDVIRWINQEAGYSPIRSEERYVWKGATPRPQELAEMTWTQVAGVWVPKSLSLAQTFSPTRNSQLDLVFEWELVNQAVPEANFRVESLLPPGQPAQIVSTESGRPQVLGRVRGTTPKSP